MNSDVVARFRLSRRTWAAMTGFILLLAFGAWLFADRLPPTNGHATVAPHAGLPQNLLTPTPTQWESLTIEPVAQQVFRSEIVTEGKIAIDEDHSTQIFSSYSGRVTRILANPGDKVVRGQTLFAIEATDMVQAQNDFIAGIVARNKASSQLAFAEIDERRYRTLSKDRAVSTREVEQAQTALTAARNDLRASETALEAARNRLRILGRTDEEITKFEETGRINPETPINSPIAGTIVQRKIGPGQYVVAGATDPAFIVGDVSTVWLVAYVRESEIAKVRIGQPLRFKLLAYPNETFRGNINYVASTLEAGTRRLYVRATISNNDTLLKPEMYASVSISVDEGDVSPAVPREAVIYEGDTARVWVALADNRLALRPVQLGVSEGRLIQVLAGLQQGERVVTRGSLFIDRIASGT